MKFPKLLAAACAVVALLLAFFVTEPQSSRAALAPDGDGIAAVDGGLDEALPPADPLLALVPPSWGEPVHVDHPRLLTRLALPDVFRPPQARA